MVNDRIGQPGVIGAECGDDDFHGGARIKRVESMVDVTATDDQNAANQTPTLPP
ncbi:hypothetical protein RSSM_00358 [Rhodopirellula sallentina SM41]|uniref:Uncharacterized protein n=1 Tax=Rhodopirellula sallentina SM41 TaxID=1263870 RepID=M5U9T2_9BACT|nr:hypothetical protein RSSM_00358 [Rhodopirellula sallentina SM41]